MRTGLGAAAAAVLMGCEGAAPTAPRGSAMHDGIRYSATTVIVDPATARVRTTLTLRNVSDGARTVTLGGGCPFFVRVYATAAHTPPPIYDQAANEVCTAQALLLTLEPGQSWTTFDEVVERDILGSTAPPGVYAFVAVVPLSVTLTIDAGSATLHR